MDSPIFPQSFCNLGMSSMKTERKQMIMNQMKQMIMMQMKQMKQKPGSNGGDEQHEDGGEADDHVAEPSCHLLALSLLEGFSSLCTVHMW